MFGPMSNTASLSSAETTYLARLADAKGELQRLDRIGLRLANARLAAFLAALLLALATVFSKLPGWGFGAALAMLGVYTGFAVRHARVIRREQTAKTLVLLNERGLQRLAGQWREL